MIETKYIELGSKIQSHIAAGMFQGRIPGVARLAEDFNVDPKTAAKAIHYLENKGIIEIRGKLGAFIIEKPKVHYGFIAVVGVLNRSDYQDEINAIENAAAENNFGVMVAGFRRQDIINDPSKLDGLPAQGLLFMYSALDLPIIEHLRKNQKSFLSLNELPCQPPIPWVSYNTVSGVRCAFARLNTPRRTAFIAFRSTYDYFENQMKTVYTGLSPDSAELYRVASSEPYVRQYGSKCEYMYGRDVMRELLKCTNPPQSAFVTSPDIACGTADALSEKGIRVPEDFEIAVSGPALESHADRFILLEHPRAERSRRGTAELIKIVNGSGDVPQILLDFTLKTSAEYRRNK